MASGTRQFQAGLVCALLVVATLAAYWPVRQCGFVNFDDPSYVVENRVVGQGLTWAGVVWAFRTGHAGNWHPVTWLSHMADVQLFGLRPGPHHLVNLLFHVANALLLFLLLRRMTDALWRSAFVAALFAVHPLHVESVAWVAERKDVLSTFFGLLAIWAYVGYAMQSEVQSPKSKVQGGGAKQQATHPTHQFSRSTFHVSLFYLLSLVLFALSLMSKPMLVTLPFVLLLLDFWPLNRWQSRGARALVVEKMPLMVLSAVSCVVTYLAQEHTGAVASADAVPLGSRVLNAVVAYCAYIGKAIWPVRLAIFYPYSPTQSFGQAALAAAFLVAVTAAAWHWRSQWPHLMVGWLWFLGTLVPVIGLVQVGYQSLADRYTYVPLVGLFVILAWSVPALSSRRGALSVGLAVGGGLAILVCAGFARAQVARWQDSETLFRHAVAVTSGNFLAHLKLGQALAARGALSEARAEFVTALSITPGYLPAVYDLANLLRTNRSPGEALSLFRQAVQMRPQDAAAHYNLAIALRDQQRPDEAAEHYREALRLDPAFASAHNNLANLLLSEGKVEEALAHALAAVRLNPGSAPAHLNAGNALFLQEKFAEAEAHYAAAARLEPGNAEVQLNLGKALVNQDKLAEAETRLKEAARLEPTNAEPHQILAAIYAVRKQGPDSAREYEIALRLGPAWPEGLNALAWIRATHPDAELRDGAQAVQLASRACDLTRSTNAAFLETLAAAYAEAQMFTEAVSYQQMACDLAAAQGQASQASIGRLRLEQYRSRQPLREPAGR
jgi:protein O-mannosyl-transferase